jgi:hypothetical protein
MVAVMTSAERLEAALEGRPVDHLPFAPFLAYLWESLPESVQSRGRLAFNEAIGADSLWRGAPCPVVPLIDGAEIVEAVSQDGLRHQEIRTPVGTLHRAWQTSETGNTAFLVQHPLKREGDWKTLLWLEEHTRFALDLEPVEQHFEADGRRGLSVGILMPRTKTAFQSLVEQEAGTQELAYALADFPDTVEALWRRMMENDLIAARLAAEADTPYRYFITWEDSGTQNYSPSQYARFIEPEIAGLVAVLARAGGKRYIQHACGHVRRLLEPMRRSGIFAIESISPPPTGNIEIAPARELLGPDVAIIGGLEPTTLLSTSLQALEPYVEQTIAALAGGPFVLANSDSCPPGVSVEKLALAASVAKRYRP